MRSLPFVLTFLAYSFFASAQKKEVKLLFVGDAMQHTPQVQAAKTKDGTYNYDSCFHLLKDKISSADIACVNFETVLGKKPYTGYPMFSAPDEFAFALKDAGFNLFVQASNHAVDKGRKGLERTIDILDSIGVKHTGTFKSPETRKLYYPLMIIKNGIRMAFLNYVYDTNGLPVTAPNIVNLIDTNRIKRDLHFTQLYKPDIIIAVMHWGEEYYTYPTPQQRKLAQLLFENGVRLIVGHHPHVVEPITAYRRGNTIDRLVFYSLGNFVSNQNFKNTDGGMVAEIVISKADDAAKAVIESYDYSFVWVRKYYDKGRLKYTLIPTHTSTADIYPKMSVSELQKMERYVTNAKKILEKQVP